MGLSRSVSGADFFAEVPSVPAAVAPAQPTPLQARIAEHRTAIVSGTVAGHFAHWQYLTRFRRIDPYAGGSRRFAVAAASAGSTTIFCAAKTPLLSFSEGDMSADFWAGYLSGVIGIVIGNPLDVIKVQLQAQRARQTPAANSHLPRYPSANFITGTAAPILGYGALNALLFVSYNRAESALDHGLFGQGSLWSTWIAGALGGLATWVVSTPTELIKCRAQLSTQRQSSWAISKQVWQLEGIRGLYFGGVVTALRDSVGYGFYFWSYELSTRMLAAEPGAEASLQHEAAKVLLCGGLAGVATWASVFPLDVIKTRVQTQPHPETSALLGPSGTVSGKRHGAWHVAREAYRHNGTSVFFRGLFVCSVRAFMVNAVQWAVYEWIMYELGQGRKRKVDAALPNPS